LAGRPFRFALRLVLACRQVSFLVVFKPGPFPEGTAVHAAFVLVRLDAARPAMVATRCKAGEWRVRHSQGKAPCDRRMIEGLRERVNCRWRIRDVPKGRRRRSVSGAAFLGSANLV
jgi:hypothetical protein